MVGSPGHGACKHMHSVAAVHRGGSMDHQPVCSGNGRRSEISDSFTFCRSPSQPNVRLRSCTAC